MDETTKVKEKEWKLYVDPTRVTHLMKSIRIDLRDDFWTSNKESVGVVPLEATKEWVKLKIIHAVYKNNVGTSDTKIVKFFFNGKDPELIETED